MRRFTLALTGTFTVLLLLGMSSFAGASGGGAGISHRPLAGQGSVNLPGQAVNLPGDGTLFGKRIREDPVRIVASPIVPGVKDMSPKMRPDTGTQASNGAREALRNFFAAVTATLEATARQVGAALR